MKEIINSNHFYQVLSIVVLALFYGIYYTKMFVQRKKGIKTNQIGSVKKRSVFVTELLMSIATLTIVIVQICSIIFNLNDMPIVGRIIGFFIGLFGDIVFLLSIICMKESWRAGIPSTDKTKLVTNGIYKYSRNPAFLGFDLMYIGILLLNFNIVNMVFTIFAIVMLHLQILQEEKFMFERFGDEYQNYKSTVNRYIGKKCIKKESWDKVWLTIQQNLELEQAI